LKAYPLFGGVNVCQVVPPVLKTEKSLHGSHRCPCHSPCAENTCKAKRFEIGDRVLAFADHEGSGTSDWYAGTIVQHDYREEGWAVERISPYQILLDSTCRFEKRYVYAPDDDGDVVRAIPKLVKDIPPVSLVDKQQTHACCDSGENCALHHVCDDRVSCPQYHFCGKEGRTKTRLWKKLAERQLRNGTGGRRGPPSDCQRGGEDVLTIPKLVNSTLPLPLEDRKLPKTCCDSGVRCALYHVCDDRVDCSEYHFCGKEGRTKTRLWKKLADRHRRNATGGHKELCSDCENSVHACHGLGDASVDAILAFVEGQHVDCTLPTHTGTRQRGAKREKRSKQKAMRAKRTDICNGGCECDCHAIVAMGSEAVLAKLREGVDFSPLFREDLFEPEDMNTCDLEELAAFKGKLQCAQGFEHGGSSGSIKPLGDRQEEPLEPLWRWP
jgi:hypothetical protein